VGALRDIGMAQINGRTVSLVDAIIPQITSSPAFAGKASSGTTAMQAASVDAQFAARELAARRTTSAVSPVFRPQTPLFSSASSPPPTKVQSGGGFIDAIKGFVSNRWNIAQGNIASFRDSKLDRTDLKILLGPLGLWTTNREAGVITGGAAALAGGAFLAGGVGAGAAASGSGLLAGLVNAIRTPGLLGAAARGGTLVGGTALGVKSFRFLESKIPPPSNTNFLQDASSAGGKVKDLLTGGSNAFISGLKGASQGATGAIGEVVSNAAQGAKDAVSEVVGGAVQGAKDAFSGAGTGIADAVGEAASDAGDRLQELIGGSGGGIIDTLKNNRTAQLVALAAVGGTGLLIYGATRK